MSSLSSGTAAGTVRLSRTAAIALFVVAHVVAVALMWRAAEFVAKANADHTSDHSFQLSLFPVPESALPAQPSTNTSK